MESEEWTSTAAEAEAMRAKLGSLKAMAVRPTKESEKINAFYQSAVTTVREGICCEVSNVYKTTLLKMTAAISTDLTNKEDSVHFQVCFPDDFFGLLNLTDLLEPDQLLSMKTLESACRNIAFLMHFVGSVALNWVHTGVWEPDPSLDTVHGACTLGDIQT